MQEGEQAENSVVKEAEVAPAPTEATDIDEKKIKEALERLKQSILKK